MCEQDNDNYLKLRCRDQYRIYDRPGQSSGGLGVMGQFFAILGKEDSYIPRSFCVAFKNRWLTVKCRNAPAHNKQIPRATAKGRAPPPGLKFGPLILESVLPVSAAHEYLRKSIKRLSAMAAIVVQPLFKH
ncbi:hypothetical protein PoMZ_05034 [Pyricularia oryzae]|uniref:Uncharacterized protein n=1 Tax=Pyricularia oryzae TaxID=318829 RepID=A0A4P7NE42_PYROR|nr:hypothetical protein PoMZ_05034 [Pyricularia oryzae]